MKFRKAACVSVLGLTALLGACNADIRPAPQGPRYYTAAHDTIDGECRREHAPLTNKHDGKFTVEDALPMKSSVVRCVTDVAP